MAGITLVQCWPNVMHQTQLGHVKTSQRCTLDQRWVNVVFSTNVYPKPKWQAYVGQMLAQSYAPNTTRSCSKVTGVHWPTLGQRNIFNKFLSKPKWQTYVGLMLAQRNSVMFKQVTCVHWPDVGPTKYFQQTFIQDQSGRHTLVQCCPNVMRPTHFSPVKTSHRCTLAQRWADVLIPTRYLSDCQ